MAPNVEYSQNDIKILQFSWNVHALLSISFLILIKHFAENKRFEIIKKKNLKAFGAPLEFWLACVLMLCTHWALPISARRFRLRNPSCLTAARKNWGHRRTADGQSEQGDPSPGHSPVRVRLSWPGGQCQGQNYDNWQRHAGPGNFCQICDSWRGS